MELMKKLEKYNKEEWILFDNAQEQFEKNSEAKKRYMIESDNLSEQGDFPEGYDDRWIVDDIEALKDVVAYSEINSFKGKLFSDMNEKERSVVIPRIIGSLSVLDAGPMAYTVKDDSIKLAWYVTNSVYIWSLADSFAVLSNEWVMLS